jgi:four helix bundle protein
MNNFKTHKDLDVWRKSMDFTLKVYKLSGGFPKNEMYGLTSQIRRAAMSIPSNIAEGAARKSRNEFINFLYYSIGSLSEVETQLELGLRLNYYSNSDTYIEEIEIIRKMLYGLVKYEKSKI